MSITVNTNISSVTTQRYIAQTQMSLQTAMQRLSSGLRINSAKDDAAGLAIASRLNAQVNGSTVAARNANDGISLSQTAEGTLQTISTNLQSIRQLAVQASNASNSDTDRASLNQQAQALLQEIDRAAGAASFNGIKLLDGSFKSKQFQVGANAGDTVTLDSIASARISKLGSSSAAAITSAQSSGTSALADGDLTINGVTIGAAVTSADKSSTSNLTSSAISKAAAINAKTSLTGVTATVNATEVAGTSMGTATATAGSIVLNGTTISIQTTSSNSSSRSAVVAAINAYTGQTGVTAVDTGSDADGVKLTAADGRNIVLGSFTNVTAALTGLGAASTTYTGSYTLTSKSQITIGTTASGTIGNSGLSAGTYSAQTAYASGVASTSATTGNTFTAGDFSINGVLIGSSLSTDDTASVAYAASSAIAKAAAINRLTASTGVTATANATEVKGGSSAMSAAATTGTLTINGVNTANITTSASSTADSRAAVVTAINAISGQTGVTAVDTGSDSTGIKLVAADGRNISVYATTAANTTGLTAAATGLNTNLLGSGSANQSTFAGSVTLSSAGAFTIAKGTTNNTVNTVLGLGTGTYGSGRTGQGLDTISLATASGASDAITAVDNALNAINESRASLGAINNRLSSVVDTLATTSENLTASVSRIQDADFAAETANYTKSNVLAQAANSMLAQANSNSQQVLSLLQRL